MKVNVYKSQVKADRYFLLKEGSSPSVLPENVMEKPLKSLDLQPGENRITLSSDEAIKGIEAKGYFQIDSSIQIFEK